MTGPLVDPFPWTRTEGPDRIISPARFDRLLRRFLVAEELIRARDTLREMTALGMKVDNITAQKHVGELTQQFDALGARPIPQQRMEYVRAPSLDRVPVS